MNKYNKYRYKTLLLCMTPGISLSDWEKLGLIKRELQIYERYVEKGWKIKIIEPARHNNPPPLSMNISSVKIGWTLRRLHLLNYLNFSALLSLSIEMEACDVVKTNQAVGAWYYALAARIAKRPILLRCGWLPGKNLEYIGRSKSYLWVLRFFEKLSMYLVNAIEVATEEDKEFICERYGVSQDKINLFPNWIDTDLFAPANKYHEPRSVITVGRIESVKRLDFLIHACRVSKTNKLTIVGQGPLRNRLADMASQIGVNVCFVGIVDQQSLPDILNSHQVFVLCSSVEGHPKALLEAMSCGLPCVGTDSPGIKGAIADNHNGLIANSDPKDIGRCISRLFDDSELRKMLGNNARKYILSHCAFDTVFRKESSLLNMITKKWEY